MTSGQATLIAIIVGVIGFLSGSTFAEKYWKQEAYKHGKAEYYLDQNNERQWRWK